MHKQKRMRDIWERNQEWDKSVNIIVGIICADYPLYDLYLQFFVSIKIAFFINLPINIHPWIDGF